MEPEEKEEEGRRGKGEGERGGGKRQHHPLRLEVARAPSPSGGSVLCVALC